MDIAGAQGASLLQRPDAPTLGLQINQRFAAEVLNVSGDQVTLVLEGTPFVARLTTTEQAAALQGQRLANFIVRENSGSLVQLQLLPRSTVSVETPSTQPAKSLSTLIPSLLRLAGLPQDDANQTVAQALIKQGLPVNADLVFELRNTLANVRGWGQEQASQAAILKASGLPLSPAALTLALNQNNQNNLSEIIDNLKARLEQLARDNPQRATELQEAISLLNQMSIEWGASDTQLAEELQQTLTLLSHPLERDLLQFLKNHVPALGALEDQASFEQELAKLMREQLSFLSPEDMAAFQNDLSQLISNFSDQLNTPQGQTAFERELLRLIQNRAPFLNTPEGQASFGRALTDIIQDHAPFLNALDGQVTFEYELLKLLQNYAHFSNMPEEQAAFERQLSQLIQNQAYAMQTPQGQANFERELANLIQSHASFLNTPQGLAALERDLAGLLQPHVTQLGTPEGQTALIRELMQFTQQYAPYLNTLEGQAAFEREIAQLIQSQIAALNTPAGQAAFERDLRTLIQNYISFPNPQGRTGLEQEIENCYGGRELWRR